MNKEIRSQFPILKEITYFDNAALVLKPTSAINALNYFYNHISVSTRTADTPLGNIITKTISDTRKKIAKLLDDAEENIIFTSGTTESINNICYHDF
ncbi:aminotransferase class V-fold PLP-dependent enzyme [Mycoplasma crocodyli]|uniref:aminotransferase class V-fold PLP-dependent enzyme n=1 Tax=Mycoplasma crocodyli TaxID=50052 RepID=UPI0003080D28|nr:aminotransferase class V-fold PLP-dependent enzyme [Mycoplasma crocodyli]